MKKKKFRDGKPAKQEIRLWTYREAVQAVPYVDSILRSLRESLVETNRLRLHAERLADRPGRRTRDELIDLEETRRQADRAYDRYLETLEELQDVGVGCSDPVNGEAIFPFIYQEQVAWFTYHVFEGPYLQWWRYDSDTPDTRRPIYLDMKQNINPTTV